MGKVEEREHGPQVFLSRTDVVMLEKLMALEVPEIYDGIVKIEAVVRDPGAKSKVAVSCFDSTIDPARCCIGPRGSRINAISNEFNGEKIDVVLYTSDIKQFAINAISRATVERIFVSEAEKLIDVVVAEDQLSRAIGRGGQNVKLASKLVGYEIRVMTEAQESEKRLDEFQACTENLVKCLDIDEILAQLLISEGVGSIEAIVDM